jgi:hypothetical protein
MHAVALAKFVFESEGYETCGETIWQTTFASVSGQKQTGFRPIQMTGPSRFEDAELSRHDWLRSYERLSRHPRLCAGEADFRPRSDSSIGGQSK